MTLIQVKVIEDIDLKFGTHIHQSMLCNIYSFFILMLRGNFFKKKTAKNVDFSKCFEHFQNLKNPK